MISLRSLKNECAVFLSRKEPFKQLARSIFLTYSRCRHLYKPTFNDPRKEDEVSEPGVDDKDESFIEIPTRKQLKARVELAKNEFSIWKREWKDRFTYNQDVFLKSDEVTKLYSFSNDETIEEWATLSDSDEGFGYSSCSLTRSPNGCALFSGNLSTKCVNDGKTFRSGFCAANGPRAEKSFKRKTHYQWYPATHLVLKVRGDGRKYYINISTEGHYDLSWHDTYSYPLYTRGGPYWQTTKIPFSKFIFSSRGYVQDTQSPIDLEKVSWVGIGISDDIQGPFNLEIDYIGIEEMTSHVEEHAYESYNFDGYFHKWELEWSNGNGVIPLHACNRITRDGKCRLEKWDFLRHREICVR